MSDERILTKIDIQTVLDSLPPADRELILLAYKYELPPGYEGAPWPMSLTQVGQLWGKRWYGQEFSEAAVRYKRDAVLARWREAWNVQPPIKNAPKSPKTRKKRP